VLARSGLRACPPTDHQVSRGTVGCGFGRAAADAAMKAGRPSMANSWAFGRRSKVQASPSFGAGETEDRSGSGSDAADCLRAYWRADVDLNREALGVIPVLSLFLGSGESLCQRMPASW